MQDALYSGRPFRTLKVVDDSNREALAVEIDTWPSDGGSEYPLAFIVLWYGADTGQRMKT